MAPPDDFTMSKREGRKRTQALIHDFGGLVTALDKLSGFSIVDFHSGQKLF
jgi:hypothetical protein